MQDICNICCVPMFSIFCAQEAVSSGRQEPIRISVNQYLFNISITLECFVFAVHRWKVCNPIRTSLSGVISQSGFAKHICDVRMFCICFAEEESFPFRGKTFVTFGFDETQTSDLHKYITECGGKCGFVCNKSNFLTINSV